MGILHSPNYQGRLPLHELRNCLLTSVSEFEALFIGVVTHEWRFWSCSCIVSLYSASLGSRIRYDICCISKFNNINAEPLELHLVVASIDSSLRHLCSKETSLLCSSSLSCSTPRIASMHSSSSKACDIFMFGSEFPALLPQDVNAESESCKSSLYAAPTMLESYLQSGASKSLSSA